MRIAVGEGETAGTLRIRSRAFSGVNGPVTPRVEGDSTFSFYIDDDIAGQILTVTRDDTGKRKGRGIENFYRWEGLRVDIRRGYAGTLKENGILTVLSDPPADPRSETSRLREV
jgi:hypothetical protein